MRQIVVIAAAVQGLFSQALFKPGFFEASHVIHVTRHPWLDDWLVTLGDLVDSLGRSVFSIALKDRPQNIDGGLDYRGGGFVDQIRIPDLCHGLDGSATQLDHELSEKEV